MKRALWKKIGFSRLSSKIPNNRFISWKTNKKWSTNKLTALSFNTIKKTRKFKDCKQEITNLREI